MAKKILKIIIISLVILLILAVGFVSFYPPFGDVYSIFKNNDYASRTDLYYDGTFHGNPEINVMSDQKSQFSDDEQLMPNETIPINELSEIPDASIDELKWVWFGHSSSLLQMQGLNILIDPVFSDYASPMKGFGPKRFSDIPIDIENLPEIDILVISHDHYDHLDYDTIKKIDDKVKFYCVPLGVENHLLKWNINEDKIHSMAWWENINIDGLTIISVPGRHYTGRTPWLNNTTLWSGFVFQNESYQTYYTGDTGYGDHFQEIKERYGPMDLVILENGQYDNSWEEIHLLPEQGIQAIKELEAKWFVPVHWGTFSISYHSWDEPIKHITRLAQAENLNMASPMIGDIVDYTNISQYQDHWWEAVK